MEEAKSAGQPPERVLVMLKTLAYRTVDAARHCVSNIRPAGLPIISAANRLIEIFTAASRHRMTGVALAGRLAAEAGSQLGSTTESA